MPLKKIDLLLHCRWLIPIIPENQVLENCSIAINAGRIIELLPKSQARQHFSATEEVELNQHVVMPGLVNTHCHSAMRLLRGRADDLPLQTWLEKYLQSTDSLLTDPDFVRDSSALAMAEMIKTGTTCFAEMYCFSELIADVIRNTGMRSQIGFTVHDSPTPYAKDANEHIHRGLTLYDNMGDHPLIKVACAPQSPNSISDTVIKQLATFANELDLPIHIHCHESASEIAESLTKQGCRPLQRLNNMGLLLPQTQLVHMTQISPEDQALLEQTNSNVIHCPEANLKLANGFCPVTQLMQAGINVSLGTESAASNNDLDLFRELKSASLVGKAVCGDASALDAHSALRLATINGARTLGWDQEIGSLEAGKCADIIALEIDSIAQQPLYNPASQLVYGQSGSQVTHSWVAGQPLLMDKKLLVLNEHNLIQSAKDWHSKIAG